MSVYIVSFNNHFQSKICKKTLSCLENVIGLLDYLPHYAFNRLQTLSYCYHALKNPFFAFFASFACSKIDTTRGTKPSKYFKFFFTQAKEERERMSNGNTLWHQRSWRYDRPSSSKKRKRPYKKSVFFERW